MESNVEATPEPESPVIVRFTDRPGIRLITSVEWAKAGVKGHTDTYWRAENNWAVKKDDLELNDEQFSRIIMADPNFRIELAREE